MGETLKEMNLDVGLDFASKTISDILTEVSGIEDFSKKSSKLDFHVHALEEEMRKIEAFKRELPNCLHLLKDAIERLKEENKRETRPVMEKFILFKNDGEVHGRSKVSNDFTEKKNWMSSVQLWSTPVHYENSFATTNQDSVFHLKSGSEEGEGNGSETQFQGCNFKNRIGAFVPFKKQSMKEKAPVDGLSLSIPETEVESTAKGDCGFDRPKLEQLHLQEQQRKQRRCWSPELHKRFVDALHQLGGAQTATPKQIRELMKVDGLTNDEVKSHLQKYRIHIKKLPTSSVGPSNNSSLAQGQCGDLLKPVGAHSGSP